MNMSTFKRKFRFVLRIKKEKEKKRLGLLKKIRFVFVKDKKKNL